MDGPVMTETTTDQSQLWDLISIALGGFLFVAGVMHFVSPSFFDAIVPPWL